MAITTGSVLKAALLGALSLGTMMTASAPASAQFFGGWFGGWGEPAFDRGGVIPPRIVASILRAQGFRMTDLPARNGDRIIALGMDGRGQMMRFVLDAHDGAVIRTALVGAPRPPGYIGGADAYAYGAPGIPGDIDAGEAPRPKPKAKVKTAARPPAAPPVEAAPASPAPIPSDATHAPVPAKPAIPPAAAKPAAKVPPVAATPPVSPPPIVRPAPDAQPADIGPKVVPVKPAEARAPEVAPVAPPVVAPLPVAPAPAIAAPDAAPLVPGDKPAD